MPFTILAHQAVVLPLKLAAPERSSGTALVLGSMAPDLEYVMRTYPTGTIGHSWIGQIVFCLPVTLVSYWLVRRVIAPAVVEVSGGPPASPGERAGGRDGDRIIDVERPRVPRAPLRIGELAALAAAPRAARPRWTVVGICALVGSMSHVLLDRGEAAVVAAVAGSGGSAIEWNPAAVVVQIAISGGLAIAAVLMLRRVLPRSFPGPHAGDAPGAERGRTVPADVVRPISVRGVRYAARADEPSLAPGAGATAARAFWPSVAAVTLASATAGIVVRRPGFHLDDPATWIHVGLAAAAGGLAALVAASALWLARRPGPGGG